MFNPAGLITSPVPSAASQSRAPRRTPTARLERRIALVLAVVFLLCPSAWAWNGVGHELVSRIAWLEMTPAARSAAVHLLEQTDRELAIRDLRPAFGARRDQIWFERASTWPDWVRSELPSENRPGWHYTNFFWTIDARGNAVDLPERSGAEINIVTELPRLVDVLSDPSRSDAERGVALAWVLHLVGDLHQPLHCSARVTEQDPRGDRGGNDFKLSPAVRGQEDWRRDNLHRLWDSSLTRRWPKTFWESEWRYRERLRSTVADRVADAPVEATIETSLGSTVASWAREGYQVAKASCYPPALVRNRPAPDDVLEAAAEISAGRIAVAGHRLASILDRALGSE